MIIKYFKIRNILPFVFFIALFLVGISSYKDYGIPWDESLQREYGNTVYNYVFHGDNKLLKNKERYYGPIVELSLTALERATGEKYIQKNYYLRHIGVFTIFFASVIAFFYLLRDRFKSVYLATLGASMLVLSPRIFAHSFYNSKDIPLLALFIISFYTLQRLLKRQSYKNIMFHSVATALAICVRILGILIPVITIISLLFVYVGFNRKKYKTYETYENYENKMNFKFFLNRFQAFIKDKSKLREFSIKSLFYMALAYSLTVMFWPTLWSGPIENLINSFNEMKKYEQSTSILYFGAEVKSTNVPWHYVFGWIAVTTPVLYLLLLVNGASEYVRKIKNVRVIDIAVLLWLVCPLAAVILLKSNLYDGWRQMYFIYPAILYIGVFGIFEAKLSKKVFLAIISLISLTYTLTQMFYMHPHQYVYFNELVTNKETVHERFEMDYWGLSYKQGLEHLAKVDKRENIRVHVPGLPGETNVNILNEVDAKRIESSHTMELPNYFMTTYRGTSKREQDKLYYTIKVYGSPILGLYKLN